MSTSSFCTLWQRRFLSLFLDSFIFRTVSPNRVLLLLLMLAHLPAGGFVAYTINCAIDINAAGTISNTATITSAMDSASATDDDTILLELVEIPTLNDWGRWWLFVGLLIISVLTIRRRQNA